MIAKNNMLRVTHKRALLRTFAMVCLLTAVGQFHAARAQSLSGFERDRGRLMLSLIKDDIKKHYYDPNFHGVDVDTRFKAAEEKIKDAASLGQVFGIIAQAVLDLDDSHTFFTPPPRADRFDYGWRMQMIGDACYVSAVKPGSDAEAKGLKPGDVVHSVGGHTPTRGNFWKMQYRYHALRPEPGLRVVIQSPDGQPRQLDVMAKIRPGKRIIDFTGGGNGNDILDVMREAEEEAHLDRHRYYKAGSDIFIWKMPAFDLMEQQVDEVMDKVRKYQSLILDLRGNSGGYEITLQRLLGHFFEQDVKIGDIKRRKETKSVTAETRGNRVFKGQLVVLVDSRSGSAAELFARVVQLEKRGTVIGDRTSGAVMRSKHHPRQMGTDTVVFYGTSITDADVIMTDGKSLERAGVMPDEVRLPTAVDLARKHDPVMSYAASLLKVKIEPDKAGALFPEEWKR